MSVNAPETPVQAEVIFVVEATSAMFPYTNELKTNYIIPTLEYFHGGALEEGSGNGSVYCLVTYLSADCYPSPPVEASGPFSTPQELLDAYDKIECLGGHAENFACMTEALVSCMECFDDLGRTELPKHVVLMSISQPYSSYGGGIAPPGVATTPEQAARQLAERGVNFSIAAPKRWTVLTALYEQAGGDLHSAQQRNYAKDPRHLVLLRGYSLKERPPSPAPPPAPEVQADAYSSQSRPGPSPSARPAAPYPRAAPRAWLSRPQLYSNSALLTQLAQPSYPPPPQMAPQRLPGMLASTSTAAPPSPAAPLHQTAPQMHQTTPQMHQTAPQLHQAAPQLQRNYIWSGILEWMEKGKAPGDQQKVTKHLPCQVTVSSKDVEPELKVDTWPNKLLMQLMPKQLISSIGGQYLKDSKSVLFHLQPNEALDALTKVMVNGFAGCVHFSPNVSPPVCEIKVLILLYTPEKKAYLGFIPNNQATFVDRLRKVIQQQKITQIINKQQSPAGAGTSGVMGGNMPSTSMPGTSGMTMSIAGSMPGAPGLPGPAPQAPGAAPLPQLPMPQQQQQGMMGSMGTQGKGPRSVTQLDGLEAARQQNLEKIQHLQQTLEAAHQQEAQFKSQMDIMSHLHAAQAQEQHYKQLEEQRKHQLQQQLQQQLRAASPHQPPQSRLMRPLMPSNPGLRHLLQQQPQYRPGGTAPRPAAPTQQFDDVNNYSDFI